MGTTFGIFWAGVLPAPRPHHGEELMSEIELKRSFVSDLYPGARWRRRVRRMSDAQVVAIYLRERNKEPPKPPDPPDEPKEKAKDDDIPF